MNEFYLRIFLEGMMDLIFKVFGWIVRDLNLKEPKALMNRTNDISPSTFLN